MAVTYSGITFSALGGFAAGPFCAAGGAAGAGAAVVVVVATLVVVVVVVERLGCTLAVRPRELPEPPPPIASATTPAASARAASAATTRGALITISRRPLTAVGMAGGWVVAAGAVSSSVRAWRADAGRSAGSAWTRRCMRLTTSGAGSLPRHWSSSTPHE